MKDLNLKGVYKASQAVRGVVDGLLSHLHAGQQNITADFHAAVEAVGAISSGAALELSGLMDEAESANGPEGLAHVIEQALGLEATPA